MKSLTLLRLTYTNWNLFKDLATFIKPYQKQFWIGTVYRVTSDLVWLYPIWALSEIITFATDYQPGDSLRIFWIFTITILIAGLYHFPTQDIAKYYLYNVAEKIGIDARLQTLKHLFKLNANWQEKENSGNKIRKMHHGGDGLMRIVRLYVDLVVESSINLVAITVIFAQLKWELATILLIFFVSYFLIALKLTRFASHQSYVTNVEWEVLEGTVFESVNNISTIKSLELGDRILKYVESSAQKLKQEIKKRVIRFRFRQGSLNTYQEIFRQGMLFYTIWNVFQGELEVGTIALVLLYFNKIRESAGEFAQVANEWIIAKIAIMRMKDILNETPSIYESGTKSFDPNWKVLTIDDLKFAYGKTNVLKGLSLKIRRGEKIGIVGLSGGGKSTLFKLLLKWYNHYDGSIQFDDTELKTIRSKSYLSQIAVVPQETELFNFSLKENITFKSTLSKAEQKRFDNAIKTAHVHDFMHKLPEGVDSLIGEKGIKLSGGEKQRVGIARAIYREPEILFLDEATSHLDIDSEKKIQAALHNALQKTTAIVIAHRLSTIKEMDRIVVIKKGKIEEIGSFETLMKNKGEFHRLWEKQKF